MTNIPPHTSCEGGLKRKDKGKQLDMGMGVQKEEVL